ncbi:hypothetical protein D3C78_1821880 [compost metagenome]
MPGGGHVDIADRHAHQAIADGATDDAHFAALDIQEIEDAAKRWGRKPALASNRGHA